MKIVIEISKEQKRMVDEIIDIPPQVENDLISAIRHGTPLPEGNWVSIDEEPHETFECNNCGNVMCAVYDISDYKYCPNCGADMRGDTEAEGGKDCKMCRHSAETDGFNCYECVKGIQDNFEADKEAQDEHIQ